MGFTCKAKFTSTCSKCFEGIAVGDTIHVLKELEDGKKGTFHHRCFDDGKKSTSLKKKIVSDDESEELRRQMEKWFLLYTERETEIEKLRKKVKDLEMSLNNMKHMGT